MKALKQLAARICLVAGVLLSGCSDKQDVHLQLSDTNCIFDVLGGDRIITIGTNGGDWMAIAEGDDAEWFTVVKNADGILIHAPQNTELTAKRTTVVISGSIRATIDVLQPCAATETLTLSPSAQAFGFNSEGGSITITVSSKYSWRVNSSQEWCQVSVDKQAGTFTLRADENLGDKKRAEISVSVGAEGSLPIRTLTIEQYTLSEHPYLSLIGAWDLYSTQWVLDKQTLGAGVHAKCTLSQGVMNETYILKDLIMEGMQTEVYFNPEDGSVSLPLGWLVGTSTGSGYPCYLSQVNMTISQIRGGLVNGTVSADRSSIVLSDFDAGFGLGIIAKDGANLAKFSDLYYATGSEIAFRKPVAAVADNHYFVIAESVPRRAANRAVLPINEPITATAVAQ